MRGPNAPLPALLFLLLAGCTAHDQGEPPLDADSTDMFAVEADLTASSCGDGLLAAPTEWAFDVRFEREGREVRWNNGRDAVIGALSEDGTSFSIESGVELDLSEAGFGPCVVRRRDRAHGKLRLVEGTLVGFGGELSYSYEPGEEGTCQLVIGAPGGFAALPCSIRYEMLATRWP